jgi:hypothetical protein
LRPCRLRRRREPLPTLVLATGYSAGADFTGAVEVRSGYDGLLSSGCELMHRRWQTSGRQRDGAERYPLRIRSITALKSRAAWSAANFA